MIHTPSDLLPLERLVPAAQGADPRETLLPMLEGVSRALGYHRAIVALHDPNRDSLRGTVGFNVPDAVAEALEVPLSAYQSPLICALLEGTPQRVEAVSLDNRLLETTQALLQEIGIESFVVAPLRGISEPNNLLAPREMRLAPGGRQERDEPAVGVVLLSKDREAITDLDIERLMPLATQVGEALARASDAERLRDSTERYAVEKEWLWLMLNGSEDPVLLTNENNDIILHNQRAERLFKTAVDDSEGKRRAIWMNNFLFSAALSAATLGRDTRSAGRELTLVDPIEGHEVVFEMISSPATNYWNGARGLVSVLKNVTDLRVAAEQLTQNVQRLQTAAEEARVERDRLNLILRSVPNPIVLMDANNQIVTMNQEAVRLFGGAERPTRGRRSAIWTSNHAKFTSFMAGVQLESSPVKEGELVLTDPDSDEPVSMAVTTTEIRDTRGAVEATVSVMQDMSRARELERRRLEQVLFESEKLAATGRLAASIAHEINNPLEAIKNSLYLLNSSVSEGDANFKFLNIATKETERVSRILRQMLGFYRPASTEPSDINALIEEAETLVERHLRLQQVKLENNLHPAIPRIPAAPDQLKQVILNLLLNAADAMPQGGSIYVSTRVSDESEPEFLPAEAVHIQVRDTGKGIAEEHIPHIFEPFFSTKLEQKGTGLGLWVSYGIVQNHGGTIRVRSQQGSGTTFTISLPMGKSEPNGRR